MQKRKTLRWFDIAAVTVVMFGGPIAVSTTTLLQGGATPAVDFDAASNIQAGLQQAGLLGVSLGYLALRRFDFRQWNLRPTLKGTAQGAGIFLAVGAAFDAFYLILDKFVDLGADAGGKTTLDATLLGYSALNATYEELFFLGMCLAVASRHRARALAYSLAVRFSFHTYMGLPTAAAIGFGVGLAYYAVYRRLGTLYPVIVAHALADIFGSSALGLLPQ